MNGNHDFTSGADKFVYVKPVAVSDLAQDVQDEVHAAAGDLVTVFAVHNAEGEQIALVADRKLAFHLAREHDMTPASVH